MASNHNNNNNNEDPTDAIEPHSASSSTSSIPIPVRKATPETEDDHLTGELSPTSTTPVLPSGSTRLTRANSFGKGRLSVPLSRSYYSSSNPRSDESFNEDSLTRSAAENRQQTLSWTYRELQLASSKPSLEPQSYKADTRSYRVGTASPLGKGSMSSEERADDMKRPSKGKRTASFDAALSPSKQDAFARQRQVSQLSALRQLALSVEEQTIADEHEGEGEDPSSESTPLLQENAERGAQNQKWLAGRQQRKASPSRHAPREYDHDVEALPRHIAADRGSRRHTLTGRFGDYSSKYHAHLKAFRPRDIVNYIGFVFATMPAVVLALILNLLDAMSYGIIIFPSADGYIPDTAIQSGISMFLASTVISQLVYTLGGSAFKGAVGSMMIEVMPFLHIICRTIHSEMRGSSNHAILATIMVAYAMSTLLTGTVFLLLGIFKLGNLVQFFPRHILVGCIGGIGFFLLLTGVEVTTGITTAYTMQYLHDIFQLSSFKLWGASLALAISLKLMQRRIHHALFVPIFYVCIPILFYIIVFIGRFSIEDVRSAGWLISLPEGPPAKFYEFWTYFDFGVVDWGAIPATIPTQLALAFFGILHVPINVPALAVSTHQDVDLNRELIGHGVSNLVSGLFGTTQNYLVYSNSILYIRSGGNSVTGGLLLALGTGAVWMAGGKVIGFVPTIVVGSLIFHLGIDLLKESVWDTWNTGIHMLEYMTILSIVSIMGIVGFTEGILAGVIMACIFFVVMYARRSVIRSTYSGAQLRSTVHRLYRQQAFLDQVGDQIQIIKLQGFIFFGTINQLDVHIASSIASHSQLRFIVLDFSLIYGIDYSALESFHRIKRVLREKNIHLVFAGLSTVGRTLAQSGLFEEEEVEDDLISDFLIHAFEDVNEALEWCENQLLVTYYHTMTRKDLVPAGVGMEIPTRHDIADRVNQRKDTGLGVTPRQVAVLNAASLVFKETPITPPPAAEHLGIVAALLQASSEPQDFDAELLRFVESRFERVEAVKHTVFWIPGEESRDIYLVQQGELVLSIPDNESRTDKLKVVETLLPGAMVGELELFSNRPHTCRLVAATDVVVWRLTKQACDEMTAENPKLMIKFITQHALGFDATRMSNFLAHWAQLK
ncbi:sulfate transporter family-domain-containing protein [Fimicolochytrium jonesii]|uniref:sulfate transporter family-domain-containing protein n=1 Tax=Fimicolochytrium jonesii TaxID=1396493 RepID=UPI0022FE0F10|nr:sulfate transporter family-domain-containing protein [Fimicolochytrium jonesii]KAI8823013.1 sulfate transporter family-domain-containing protein [Fimicolochytrium jonesii]